ncbi:MAG: hypothetical protein EAZ82_12220 [Verrucomicrobia bacterium]|nr:MAG: hypothetical protein EAZ82_12220 [Verrucomicrobiota bacterium]
MKTNTINTASEINGTPTTVFRVSIHNQIFTTTYYVVTEWTRGKVGGYSNTGRIRLGMRGKGNSLGLTYSEAAELASKWNRKAGWTAEMQVLNSKGGAQFHLHA